MLGLFLFGMSTVSMLVGFLIAIAPGWRDVWWGFFAGAGAALVLSALLWGAWAAMAYGWPAMLHPLAAGSLLGWLAGCGGATAGVMSRLLWRRSRG